MKTLAWHDGQLAALDTETSGLGPRPDAPDAPPKRIVTASLLIPGRPARSWLLNPRTPFEQTAVDTHGITPEHASEHGTDYAAGIRDLADAVDEATSGRQLVIYNAQFDLTLLVRECERLGIGFTTPEWVIDPLVLDRAVDRYRKGSRKLVDVAPLYGVTLAEEDAHAADADARAAGNLAHQMALRARAQRGDWAALHGLSYEQLQAWQAAAHRRSSDSLRAFWQGNQDPRWETVDSGWPLLENPPFQAVA